MGIALIYIVPLESANCRTTRHWLLEFDAVMGSKQGVRGLRRKSGGQRKNDLVKGECGGSVLKGQAELTRKNSPD